MRGREKSFKVAFSYASEQRAIVRPIAEALAGLLDKSVGTDLVFYDEWHEAWLKHTGSDDRFFSVYVNSPLIVVCLSRQYANKTYPRREKRIILDRRTRFEREHGSFHDYHHEFQLRFDDCVVDGFPISELHTDPCTTSASEVAREILEKLKFAESAVATSKPLAPPKVGTQVALCNAVFSPIGLRAQAATVERRSVIAQIAAASESDAKVVVVHGEEGCGKSVAIDQWRRSLVDHFPSPSVVPCLAHDVVDFLPDVERVLAHALEWKAADDFKFDDLTLFIDGINEHGSPADWWQFIERVKSTPGLRLIVSTRSEHWGRIELERQRFVADIEPSSAKVVSVLVPNFTQDELAEAMQLAGSSINELTDQQQSFLRRPRRLAVALRHLDKIRLQSLTAEMLQLFEAQAEYEAGTAGSGDFDTAVAERVTQEIEIANERHRSEPFNEYLKGLDQSHKYFRLDPTGRPADDAWLRLGVWLKHRLTQLQSDDICDFIELAENVLGTSEHDDRATILGYAFAAALCQANRQPLVLRAILNRWLLCQNNREPPLDRIGRFLPEEPTAILAEIESIADHMGARLYRPLARVLVRHTRSCSQVVQALSRWLGFVSEEHPFPQNNTPEHCLRVREHCRVANEIRTIGLVSSRDERPYLRSTALHVLLSAPERCDAELTRRALVSIAVNPDDGTDTTLFAWVVRKSNQDRRALIDRTEADFSSHPDLFDRIRSVSWHVAPIREHKPKPYLWPEEEAGYRLEAEQDKRLRQQALNPRWIPREEDTLRLRRRADHARTLFASADAVPTFAFGEVASAIALFLPDEFALILDTATRNLDLCQDRQRRDRLEILGALVTALSRDQQRRLFAIRRWLKKGDSQQHDWEQLQLSHLMTLTLRQREIAIRRSAKHQPPLGLSVETIEIARLDTSALSRLFLTLRGSHRQVVLNGLWFILSRQAHYGRELCRALCKELDALDVDDLDDLQTKRRAIVAWRADATSFHKKWTTFPRDIEDRLGDLAASDQTIGLDEIKN